MVALVDEVRVDQVVHGEDERDACGVEGVAPPLQLGRFTDVEPEVEVHDVHLVAVLPDPVALQRRRRPPLSGGSPGHDGVRQVNDGGPVSWLRAQLQRIRVGTRDGQDPKRASRIDGVAARFGGHGSPHHPLLLTPVSSSRPATAPPRVDPRVSYPDRTWANDLSANAPKRGQWLTKRLDV